MTKITYRPLPPLEVLDELFEIDKTSPSGLRRKKDRFLQCQGRRRGWLLHAKRSLLDSGDYA